MKGRRDPYRRRADGNRKGTHDKRVCYILLCRVGVADMEDRPPSPASAERTRSARWLAGCCRAKRGNQR